MARSKRNTREYQRRWRMIRAYTAPGATAQEVADRFGIKVNSLRVNMVRWGVRLPAEEARSRYARANQRAAVTRMVWPDCPEHLQADFDTLSRYMSKREARAKLEAGL